MFTSIRKAFILSFTSTFPHIPPASFTISTESRILLVALRLLLWIQKKIIPLLVEVMISLSLIEPAVFFPIKHSFYLFIFFILFIYFIYYFSFFLFIYLFIYSFIFLFIYLSIYLYVYLNGFSTLYLKHTALCWWFYRIILDWFFICRLKRFLIIFIWLVMEGAKGMINNCQK